jgi:hypothetical protein
MPGERQNLERLLQSAYDCQHQSELLSMPKPALADNKGAQVPPVFSRRFGFAGLCFLTSFLLFAAQMFYSVIGSPPSWIGAVVCLSATALLIIIGIWFWDRSAVSHWIVRSISTVVVLALAIGIGFSPIRKQYLAEHKPESKPEEHPRKDQPTVLVPPTPNQAPHEISAPSPPAPTGVIVENAGKIGTIKMSHIKVGGLAANRPLVHNSKTGTTGTVNGNDIQINPGTNEIPKQPN